MTRHMVAGNWKMFKTPAESKEFAIEFAALTREFTIDFPVCLFPNFLSIGTLHGELANINNLFIGAQNCHQGAEGAYTGETSTSMIKEAGAEYVLIGHSERREYFSENGAQLLAKTHAALKNGLTPVFCCGEKLEERKSRISK